MQDSFRTGPLMVIRAERREYSLSRREIPAHSLLFLWIQRRIDSNPLGFAAYKETAEFPVNSLPLSGICVFWARFEVFDVDFQEPRVFVPVFGSA